MPHSLQAALLLIGPGLFIVGALRDASSYTIPNWVSLALLAAFGPVVLAVGLPWREVMLCLMVGGGCLVAGMAMWSLGWVGGGDAKLLAGAGLWIGWTALPTFLVVAALTGGMLAVLLLNARAPLLRPYMLSGPGWARRLATPGESVPYGVAIAAGALTAFPASDLPLALLGAG